ncbi:hypothetical protein ACJX0J_012612, partial [Zea mays]
MITYTTNVEKENSLKILEKDFIESPTESRAINFIDGDILPFDHLRKCLLFMNTQSSLAYKKVLHVDVTEAPEVEVCMAMQRRKTKHVTHLILENLTSLTIYIYIYIIYILELERLRNLIGVNDKDMAVSISKMYFFSEKINEKYTDYYFFKKYYHPLIVLGDQIITFFSNPETFMPQFEPFYMHPVTKNS